MSSPTPTAQLFRKRSTPAERYLCRYLRAHRLAGYSLRRQEPVGPYIVDFACKKRRLVIEVDGQSHASKVEHDWLRTQYLKRLGYRVLRFSNDRVLLDTKAVLRSILRHLSTPKSRHSPLPSPREGGVRGGGEGRVHFPLATALKHLGQVYLQRGQPQTKICIPALNPLSTVAKCKPTSPVMPRLLSRQAAEARRRYLISDTNSDVGWKNLCTVPVGTVGVGRGIVGITTIALFFGGPDPPPSCATATVVTVDVMIKRVITAYLMVILLAYGRTTRWRGEYAIHRRHRRVDFHRSAPRLGSVAGDAQVSPPG